MFAIMAKYGRIQRLSKGYYSSSTFIYPSNTRFSSFCVGIISLYLALSRSISLYLALSCDYLLWTNDTHLCYEHGLSQQHTARCNHNHNHKTDTGRTQDHHKTTTRPTLDSLDWIGRLAHIFFVPLAIHSFIELPSWNGSELNIWFNAKRRLYI